ncbi:MAG: hypothetical protein HFJ45_05675 [Clostridia bacterium]|nr:hypothetical protein [Clostridia bacterium]
MEKLRKDKSSSGITLIVLVVTIIILLILSAITIHALMGEHGIINQATQEEENHRATQVEEEADIWKLEKQKAKGDGKTPKSRTEILDKLVKDKLLTEKEKEIIEEKDSIKIANKIITFPPDDIGDRSFTISLLNKKGTDFFTEKNICLNIYDENMNFVKKLDIDKNYNGVYDSSYDIFPEGKYNVIAFDNEEDTLYESNVVCEISGGQEEIWEIPISLATNLYNIDINVNVATYNETLGSFPVVFNVTGKYQDEMNYNNIVYATVNKSGLNNVQLAVELPKSTVLTIEEIYTGNSISVVEGETLSEFELIDDGEVYTCYFENDYNGSAKVASHVNNIFSPNELEEVWNWEKNYD